MSGDILSAHFRMLFEDSLSPAQQHQAVDALKDYISELKHGTDEQRRELGVLDDYDDPDVAQRKLHAALEKSYWQLVMFLRVSPLSLPSLRRGRTRTRTRLSHPDVDPRQDP